MLGEQIQIVPTLSAKTLLTCAVADSYFLHFDALAQECNRVRNSCSPIRYFLATVDLIDRLQGLTNSAVDRVQFDALFTF
jgi:hypothetical protein